MNIRGSTRLPDLGQNVVVVDLDGTLANGNHRIDYIRAKDWDGFHSRLHEDTLYEDTTLLVRRLSAYCEIVAFTARPEKYAAATLAWINKHDLPLDYLYMRPDGDFRPAQEIKVEQLTKHFVSIEQAIKRIWFALEDNEKVAEAFRNLGIPCWLVRSEGK